MSRLFALSGQYWSFNFSISPSNENSGLISFRIDWFGLLVVQGTQEFLSAPQFESIYSSALSFLYGPTLTSLHDYWRNHAPAAKSRQSCPTLCDCIDGSPPGSCPWDSPGKNSFGYMHLCWQTDISAF